MIRRVFLLVQGTGGVDVYGCVSIYNMLGTSTSGNVE